MAQNKAKILVLIHSDNGGTYELAKEIAKGMESENNAVPYIKLVKPSQNPTLKNLPVATVDELTSMMELLLVRRFILGISVRG